MHAAEEDRVQSIACGSARKSSNDFCAIEIAAKISNGQALVDVQKWVSLVC